MVVLMSVFELRLSSVTDNSSDALNSTSSLCVYDLS